jgi:hypothetical protein
MYSNEIDRYAIEALELNEKFIGILSHGAKKWRKAYIGRHITNI